jgi:hypothetical protein
MVEGPQLFFSFVRRAYQPQHAGKHLSDKFHFLSPSGRLAKDGP